MSDDTPTNPNRIQQTTVANAAEDARLAPIYEPGAGGWTPTKVANFIISMLLGSVLAIGTLLITPSAVLTLPLIAGTAMVGAAGAAISFLGLKSAGTRKLE